MTSYEIRCQLVEALRLDLVGPRAGSELEGEVLEQAPSRWYLTGFLVPLGAGEEQRLDDTGDEKVDELDEAGGTDDAQTPEPTAARRAFFPSSMGMSFLVDGKTKDVDVTVRWGDYRAGDRSEVEGVARGSGHAGEAWFRTQRDVRVGVTLPGKTEKPLDVGVPDSGGLTVTVSVKPVKLAGKAEGLLPKGTRSVSVFLVNRRRPAPDDVRDEAFAFQAELEVTTKSPLVARPDLGGVDADDWDKQVADLQYCDAFEVASGHGIATEAVVDEEGHCKKVRTCWLPQAEVERVAPSEIQGVELAMDALSELKDGEAAASALMGLYDQYVEWIEEQRDKIPQDRSDRARTGAELVSRAKIAANRIRDGIELLADPLVLEAFCTANSAMAAGARQRFGVMAGKDPFSIEPQWRPFQVAFLLMNLRGVVDPTHQDREVTDLLFFPTGGGKTEAYLGLAAFTLVLRRLRDPRVSSAGVAVLMRYTLRLLTLDQLGRAATLICALELERQKDPDKLGPWPFEIGLWVGQAATPNRMGKKGDNDSYSARAKTIAFKNNDSRPSPIPLEECPWCGTKFGRNSFQLSPNPDKPTDLRVVCANRDCAFTRDRALPILSVDEPIYRRLPCFMIATVDKFAAMPWTGRVGALFGKVDRYDEQGFYGPCDPGMGRPLEDRLPPPDLIIQDELHLISGPLGTMVGLYETALDELCAKDVDGTKVYPKIVASTATVRRAEDQVRALFNRSTVEVFPPPGLDRRFSFFAETEPPSKTPARLYLGITAQGRSLKVVLLKAYLALMAAAQKAYLAEGGARNKENPADPYMTLVGYFNSLRELGGSRRIIEDEVKNRLMAYGSRKRVGEEEGLFATREIKYDVVELTSRVSTDMVAEAKRALAQPFHEKSHVDVAIATNMISVGLDITRLGLMVVLGQPKSSAEYIQATSRVGRDPERPGLVVTLLNVHRPRDRSHYERFSCFHESFYRSVEATSVTPFSPRALDKGLAGTVVALARQGWDAMTPPEGAEEILSERSHLEFVVDCLSERARSHRRMTEEEAESCRKQVKDRVLDLLDTWSWIADDYLKDGAHLQYQAEVSGRGQRLLHDFLDPELKKKNQRHKKFRANRSLRDVEPSVNLWMRTMDEPDMEEEG